MSFVRKAGFRANIKKRFSIVSNVFPFNENQKQRCYHTYKKFKIAANNFLKKSLAKYQNNYFFVGSPHAFI